MFEDGQRTLDGVLQLLLISQSLPEREVPNARVLRLGQLVHCEDVFARVLECVACERRHNAILEIRNIVIFLLTVFSFYKMKMTTMVAFTTERGDPTHILVSSLNKNVKHIGKRVARCSLLFVPVLSQ